MLRAILFDLDNTLIERDAALARWLAARARARGVRLDGAALDEIQRADASGYADRARFTAWLAARHPRLEVDLAGLQAGIAAAVAPDPAVSQLLRGLARRYLLALVSNGGGGNQRAKLRRAQLDGCLAHVFISAEVGAAKPDPRIFERALEAVGCRPDQALLVGDHPEHDIAGAARLGLRTCWVARGRRFPPALPAPSCTIPGVTALPEVLRC